VLAYRQPRVEAFFNFQPLDESRLVPATVEAGFHTNGMKRSGPRRPYSAR
jgi:hypothetical protein